MTLGVAAAPMMSSGNLAIGDEKPRDGPLMSRRMAWFQHGWGVSLLLGVSACSEPGAAAPAAGAGGVAGTTITVPGGGGTAPGSGGGSGMGAAGGSPGGAATSGSTLDGGASGAATPDAGGAPAVAPPTLLGNVAFSVPSQAFVGRLDVGLSTAIAGAEIRYTTDGKPPTAASALHAGAPLALSETTQLRAQAFVGGVASGALSTAIYIARTFELTSDLPIVIVDGYGGGEPSDRDVYLDAAVMVFEPVGGVASLSSLPTVATRAGYHLRGQSSARFPQAPYRLELWDNANEDADYPMLGMPADSDWALIAPYYDRSLIRNPFVYELGREIGLQAPRSAYAEVFVNYADRPLERGDYQGIYWFTETIKNAEVRTNLKQLREADTTLPAISGGYIFKFDQAAAEEPELTCTGSPPLASGFGMPPRGGTGGGPGAGGTCWVDLEVVDPDPLTPEQSTWLTHYVQELHDALHATPIGDYGAYVEVASFVDYLIVNELTRNVDAYVRSAFFFKNRDGKLEGGPLWDYNFSLGVGGQNTINPEGGFQYDGSRNVNDWYPQLVDDPAFMERVKTRWQELRAGVLSDAALERRVAELSAPLASAVARDYEKWPVAEVYENPGIVRGPTVDSWEQQLAALRDFLARRTAFIDAQYRATP
jgi:hypothetical protein